MTDDSLSSDLLQRLKTGDRQAFASEFDRHRHRLKQMIQFRLDHRLRRRVDASDVLQEVYVDAHQRLRHFLVRENYSFFIWLRQLTEQRLIDVHRQHLRAGKRDVRQEFSLNRKTSATSASIARHIVAQMASPSQQVMEAELMTRIEEGLRSLETLDQEVLALRHFEELRNSEVATVLGISEAAASNRYVRALSRLREVLAGCGVADE